MSENNDLFTQKKMIFLFYQFVSVSLFSSFILFSSGCTDTEKVELDQLLSDALAQEKASSPQNAIPLYKQYLSRKPADPDVHFKLAVVSLELEDFPSAESHFLRARKNGYAPQKIQYLLSIALAAQQKNKRIVFETDPILDPENASDLYNLRAQALYRLSKLEKAAENFKKSLEAKADNTEANLGLARIALNKKDYHKANVHLDAIGQDSRQVLYLRGLSASLQGQYEKAAGYFKRVIAISESDTAAQLGLARALINLKQNEQAQELLNTILAKDSSNINALHLKSILALQQNDFTAALIASREVLAKDPGHSASLAVVGTANFASGNLEQAVSYLQRHIYSEPGNLEARITLANAYLQLGQTSDAIKLLSPALKKEPENKTLLQLMGAAYLQDSQSDMAISLLEKLKTGDIEAPDSRTLLTLAKIISGSDGELTSRFNAYLSSTPYGERMRTEDLEKAVAKNRKSFKPIHLDSMLLDELAESTAKTSTKNVQMMSFSDCERGKNSMSSSSNRNTCQSFKQEVNSILSSLNFALSPKAESKSTNSYQYTRSIPRSALKHTIQRQVSSMVIPEVSVSKNSTTLVQLNTRNASRYIQEQNTGSVKNKFKEQEKILLQAKLERLSSQAVKHNEDNSEAVKKISGVLQIFNSITSFILNILYIIRQFIHSHIFLTALIILLPASFIYWRNHKRGKRPAIARAKVTGNDTQRRSKRRHKKN